MRVCVHVCDAGLGGCVGTDVCVLIVCLCAQVYAVVRRGGSASVSKKKGQKEGGRARVKLVDRCVPCVFRIEYKAFGVLLQVCDVVWLMAPFPCACAGG